MSSCLRQKLHAACHLPDYVVKMRMRRGNRAIPRRRHDHHATPDGNRTGAERKRRACCAHGDVSTHANRASSTAGIKNRYRCGNSDTFLVWFTATTKTTDGDGGIGAFVVCVSYSLSRSHLARHLLLVNTPNLKPSPTGAFLYCSI